MSVPRCPRCGEDRLVTPTTVKDRTDYYCDVCSWIWRKEPRRHDAVQAEAELMKCSWCGIEYFMTHPKDRCMECTREASAIAASDLAHSGGE